jgi:hypothetical protein
MQHLLQLRMRDAKLLAPNRRHSSDSGILERVAKGVSADHSCRAHDYKSLLASVRNLSHSARSSIQSTYSRSSGNSLSLPTFRRYQGTAEDHGQDCGAIQKVRRHDSGPGEKDRLLSLIFATVLLPLFSGFRGCSKRFVYEGLRGFKINPWDAIGCGIEKTHPNASQQQNCVGHNPTLCAIIPYILRTILNLNHQLRGYIVCDGANDTGSYSSRLSQPREKRSAVQISCIRVELS